MFQISDLRCEFAVNPLGIDTNKPRFSWVLHHPERGQSQIAYQIRAASTMEKLEAGVVDLWDSGKTQTKELPLVEYAGTPLVSRQRAYWQVRAWDSLDQPSAYSPPAWFELGLLQTEDWLAEWIGFPGGWNGKALYVRTAFAIEKPVRTARAYICGLGWYELRLNGQKVGDRVLDPAQTDTSQRVLYTTYDIGSYVQSGLNVIGIVLGSGWSGTPKVLGQFELQFEDGNSTQIVTSWPKRGEAWWRVSDGPIISNGVYDGEVYDARMEKPGWDTPEGYRDDDGSWILAMAVDKPAGRLVSQTLEPIQVVETLHPKVIHQPKPGMFVLDAGQNLAGWALIKVQGKPGTSVVLRYAESLYNDGTVNQENLRTARASDTYILKGEGVETWEPRFTYHGFRYIQVEGSSGELTLDSIQVRVVRSAVEPVGTFECNKPLLNQLYSAIWWTEASNLHGIPTDCPQRDERMGWLNDMAARSEEAVYNFNLSRLLPKWLNDISDTQDPVTGAITDTAPYRFGSRPADPVSVCYLLIPWLLYLHYGDRRILAQHYDGMKRWVDFLTSCSTDHLLEYSHYGDWAPPIAEGLSESIGNSALARNTPGSLVSTGHYYYCATLLEQISAVLGRTDEAATYDLLVNQIREAFNAHFWDEVAGGYGTNNQACNTLALYMGLAPENRKARVIENLVRDVEAHDYHLTTGNLCTKYIMEVLTGAGRGDVAFALATQTTYPSWGYMLVNGATTIWERWENATGIGMNSHNHPMYASVGAWFYRALAGIQTHASGPGFGRFAVKLDVFSGLQYVNASLKTIRGLIESSWHLLDNRISLNVQIPVNSQAEVTIPKRTPEDLLVISESGKLLWTNGKQAGSVNGVFRVWENAHAVTITIGSGAYHFAVEVAEHQ